MEIAFSIGILCVLCIWFLYEHYHIRYNAWYIGFPKPKYSVIIEKNIMVPMPDGTKLATDVYRPRSWDKFPVILVRTPYNKNGTLQPYKQLSELFASQGYLVIIQDVRGKYKSEGKFYPYAYEALDGHTTIMWAGEHNCSNGKVALLGLSYPGSCAWLSARYKSPFLRTIITMFTTQDTYSIWINNGIPFLKGPLYWLTRCCHKKESKQVTQKRLGPVLWQLPVNQLEERVVNYKIPFYKEYLAHINRDSFWDEISGQAHVGDLDVSAYIIGGWYDPFLNGTIEDYRRMTQAPLESKNHQSRLLIGPWAHNPMQRFKEVDLGKNANFQSLLGSVLEWCDIWLKDKKHIYPPYPKVKYFLMGKNEWRETDTWPPTEAINEKYYLSINKNATHNRDGLLSTTLPPEDQKAHYKYNPRDPVLFRGSQLLREEGWIAPVDQNEIISRDEVLIFHSEPMKEDLVVAGNIKLVIFVSSEAVDTDFCAKISDVGPGGNSYNLAAGFVRMRYRNSLDNPEMIVPGTVYQIEIHVRSCANAFLKNHRIQLQITSSDFPTHNRNLNTGLNCETSIEMKEVEQTLYAGGQFESYIVLPVLKPDVK